MANLLLSQSGLETQMLHTEIGFMTEFYIFYPKELTQLVHHHTTDPLLYPQAPATTGPLFLNADLLRVNHSNTFI